MLFVDGSNVLVEMGAVLGIPISADSPSDMELSLAGQVLVQSLRAFESEPLGPHRTVRRYWFGAFCGSPEIITAKCQILRGVGFEPIIHQKTKGSAEKGVDLAVARHMLGQGFSRNYSIAVLASGDADYLGLIDDVKRMGHIAAGMFFDTRALSQQLRLSFDAFYTLPHPVQINQIQTNAVLGVA